MVSLLEQFGGCQRMPELQGLRSQL